MNIIFMGTPDFAVPSLEMLVKEHQVLAVVTQPDKPKGRGKKMLFPPVKEKALALGIPVLQPIKVREPEFIETLRGYQADMIIVVAFGQILPVAILEMPRYGCINVHGSLLPAYRGAAPMQWSVINGEKETGITTMYMAKGLDSGDMLLKEVVPITEEDTFGTVHDKMCVVGAELLKRTIEGIAHGSLKGEAQDHDKATYAPMITKETGRIDWNQKGKTILNLIRGLNPAPNAYTTCGEEVLKIWNGEVVEKPYPDQKSGALVELVKKGFLVKTGDGAFLVTEIQARGGKRMSADAYLRGHAMAVGTVFGE